LGVSVTSSLSGPPPTASYTLSLHDALPICPVPSMPGKRDAGVMFMLARDARDRVRQAYGSRMRRITLCGRRFGLWLAGTILPWRSEEHTSELQSRVDLVCRLLLEKKKTYSR